MSLTANNSGEQAAAAGPNVTIIGIGNTLYTDEGVGVHILPLLREAFKEDSNVDIVEGSTDGIRLLGPVEDTNYLIVLDAVNGGQPPGTIYTLVGEEIPAYCGAKMSVHQLGFQEVLFAARIRDRLPAHMVLFGIQPASLEFGIGLSAEVEGELEIMLNRIKNQIKEWRQAYEPAGVYEAARNWLA
jgi:hydrogenase maturation protease